jgi:radical SAM superfamily enzyme YgiQ (UPF0313 family)
MTFGVESGDQWVLDKLIKKDETLQQIETAFRLVRKHKLIVHGAFMLGIPGETLAQMYTTIKFARKLKPDAANFSIAMPFPGTELELIAREYGTIITENWYNFDFDKNTEGIIKTDDFMPEDVVTIKKHAYKQFYLTPRYIIKKFLNLRNLSDFKQNFHGLQILLKRVK